MPNIKSAKKELRKSGKKSSFNKKIKENLKSLIKKSRKAIEAKDGQAKDFVFQAMKALDKAEQKGIIKKNTCNRKKSRLNKLFNQKIK
ncbi:MAG: 30S ribosomal protein S20 [Patescibacteria group bacterium]|nr:30S ribosomal protein S20 [Patescibacteria group bacterium]